MRNKKLFVIILVGILVLCIAAYCFLFLRPTEHVAEESLFAPGQFDGVKMLSVSGKDTDGYEIVREGDHYSLQNDYGIRLNEAYLRAVWQQVENLETLYKVDTTDTSEMGFDDPLMTITCSKESEGGFALLVGRLSTVLNGYYVARSDNLQDAYIVSAEAMDEIRNAKQGFFLKNFLDFSEEDDYDRLTSVQVTGKDDFIPLKFTKDPTTFHMELPFEYVCSWYILKSEFLDYAVHLKADSFVAEEKTDAMGFDDPSYTLDYIYDGKPVRVLVGNTVNGMSYICRTDWNLAFLIAEEQLAFFKKDYRTYIGDYVYNRIPGFVDSFEVEYQGRTEHFDINPAPDPNDKYTCDFRGKTYVYEEFIPMYNRIMGQNRNRTMDAAEPETEEAARFTVRVKLVGGNEDLVYFKKISSREYEVEVNGECRFTVLASDIELMIDKYLHFVNEP